MSTGGWCIGFIPETGSGDWRLEKFGKVRADGTQEVPNPLTLKWVLPYLLFPYEREAGGSGDVCSDYPFLHCCTLHSWIKYKFFLLITLSVMKTIRRTWGWSLQVVRSTVSRRNRRKRDDDRWKRVLIGAILTLIMVGSVVALMARIWSWLVLYYMKWWARCDSNARSPPREGGVITS